MNSIVYCTDENYINQTCVSIISLCENNDITNIDIYVFIDDTISDSNKDLLYNILSKYNAVYYIFNVTEWFIKNIKPYIRKSKWSNAIYYRFAIPEYINNDVALYLDSDTIIMRDINHLFSFIDENKRICGVEHIIPYDIQHYPTINSDDFEVYINSGVLLFRTQFLREHLISIKKSLKEDFDKFPDQDAINRVFNGNITKISKLYNLQSYYLYNDYFYDEAYIIHYVQSPKPWEDIHKKYNRKYEKYYNIFKLIKNEK